MVLNLNQGPRFFDNIFKRVKHFLVLLCLMNRGGHRSRAISAQINSPDFYMKESWSYRHTDPRVSFISEPLHLDRLQVYIIRSEVFVVEVHVGRWKYIVCKRRTDYEGHTVHKWLLRYGSYSCAREDSVLVSRTTQSQPQWIAACFGILRFFSSIYDIKSPYHKELNWTRTSEPNDGWSFQNRKAHFSG